MILIPSDHDRRIHIPGVPTPVRRPVDIDQAITGFTKLRTLRVYRFESGSVIEGHAEEDEVFIVMMAGSVELTIIVDPPADPSTPVTLSAPGGSSALACAAYLPPHAAYKLVARSDSEVAYTRARAVGAHAPKLFYSLARPVAAGNAVLLEETTYAEQLGFRLLHFDAQQGDLALTPIHESEAMCESLVYIRTPATTAKHVATFTGNNAAPIWLDSTDTLAAMPGDHLGLNIAKGNLGLALIVMAR